MIEEALDHAEQIAAAEGAGAVTMAEIARRMGIRAPSLYKYFPSLHAIYDGLFARGNRSVVGYALDAMQGQEPGLDRLLEGSRAVIRWSMLHPGLAPLLYWRPIPRFVPTRESFAIAEDLLSAFRAELSTAVHLGELDSSADTDDTLRLLTAIVGGIATSQLANQPEASYDAGLFTSLTERALAMFVHQHRKEAR